MWSGSSLASLFEKFFPLGIWGFPPPAVPDLPGVLAGAGVTSGPLILPYGDFAMPLLPSLCRCPPGSATARITIIIPVLLQKV